MDSLPATLEHNLMVALLFLFAYALDSQEETKETREEQSQVDGNSINRAKPSLKKASASPRKAANVRGLLLDSTSALMCLLLFQYEIID